MSTLPDIDTSNISGITFYNVKDEQGVSDSDFDVMNFSDWSEITNLQIYDNGIDAQIPIQVASMNYPDSTTVESYLRFRCKSDGWVIIWNPVSENYFGTNLFDDESSADLIGAYNFYGIAASGEYPFIDKMESSLSHAGYPVNLGGANTVFNHYDFLAPEASNITVIAQKDYDFEHSFTQSVDRKYHYCSIRDAGGLLDSSDNNVISESTVYARNFGIGGSVLDMLNQVAQGWNWEIDIVPGETYYAEASDVSPDSQKLLGMASAWS